MGCFNLLRRQSGLRTDNYISVFFILFRSFVVWRFPYVIRRSFSEVCFLLYILRSFT